MGRIFLLISSAALMVILAMMNFTTPNEIGPLGVLVFFTMCYLCALGLTVEICRIFFKLKGHFNKLAPKDIDRRSYYYALVLALAPVLLLMNGSIGGISILGVILVFLLEVVLCFLVAKSML